MDILDPRSADRTTRETLLAWLAVQRAFALAPQKLPSVFRTEAEPGRQLRAFDIAPFSRAQGARLLEGFARLGVRALPIASPLYPPRLLRLVDAPPLLLVRGVAELLLARSVAMVGARAATSYGLSVARELAQGVARAGFVVVSGLARGIDAAAHRGALDAGGATVAFQACGPERIYPAVHRGLADEVLESGALITELPPGMPPRPPYFPLRNRLISAIAEAVVVVEARVRSGSLTTARHAAEQGIEVFAVPGPIDRKTSEGPHLLLRDGATLLTDASELLQALGVETHAKSQRVSQPTVPAPQDPLARKVWDALRSEARPADTLARDLGLAPGVLAGALTSLEIDGRARQDRDGCWTLTSPA